MYVGDSSIFNVVKSLQGWNIKDKIFNIKQDNAVMMGAIVNHLR